MTLPVLILALLAPVAAAVPLQPPPGETPTRGSVVVLTPPDVDEVTRTALARVTGELTAARFRVTVVPLDPNLDPTPQVENVVWESRAVAAFAIAHINDRGGDTIAIWVSDSLGRRTTIQRMALRGSDVSQDAEVLALEAIELIRVSIAGLWPAPARPASPAPPPPPPRPTFGLGLGVAMFQDSAVPTPQWMGSLTGTVMWPRGLAVRARVGGLGPAITLTGEGGRARVNRQVASLGIAWVFWRQEHVQPLIILAAGAERLTGSGTAPDSMRAHAGSLWSPLALAGIGAAARLAAGLSLTAEIAGILATRKLVLGVGDTETGHLSRPGILVNVGLQASF